MRFLSVFIFLISSVAVFGADYRQAAGSARSDLDGALERLEKARNKIAAERIPVSKKLSALRSEVLVLRREMEQSRAVRDNKIVDLAGIERELKQRKDEVSYLATLMSDYIQRFETQIHISEVQVYEVDLKDAKLVGDDASLSCALESLFSSRYLIMFSPLCSQLLLGFSFPSLRHFTFLRHVGTTLDLRHSSRISFITGSIWLIPC